MAPNTKRADHGDYVSPNIKTTSKVSMEDEPLKKFDVPLDKQSPLRFGKLGSYILGGISIAIYAYALFSLFNNYKTNYFRKNTDPNSVPNLLRAWGPLYAIAMFTEVIIAYLKGKSAYQTGDTVCSMLTFVIRGVIQRVLSMSVLCYGLYGLVWEHYGQYIHAAVLPQVLQESALMQFGSIIILDEFAYYWVHRFGHTINAFWNIHQVHHNGEVFNLFTGIRNSLLVRFSTVMFYLPLALMFDPPVFIIFRQFNLVYQFWIHNEFVGKLGWLEYVLNTPSQHRVHHGRAAYCIDKNFGGMTCIFDRLFGTFQEEIDEVPVVYGLTTSITTLCPWKLNTIPWINTFKSMKAVSGLKAKWKVLYDGPGIVPGTDSREEYPIPPITNNTFQIRNPIFSTPVKLLLIVEMTLGIIVFTAINNRFDKEPENYWYLMALTIHCGYAMYATGTVTDRVASSVINQLISVVTGVCLYSYGSIMRYRPEIFVRTATEIGIFCTVGIAIALLVLSYKDEIRTPYSDSEIGKDLPFAKEAEEAQWRFYYSTQKKKLA